MTFCVENSHALVCDTLVDAINVIGRKYFLHYKVMLYAEYSISYDFVKEDGTRVRAVMSVDVHNQFFDWMYY